MRDTEQDKTRIAPPLDAPAPAFRVTTALYDAFYTHRMSIAEYESYVAQFGPIGLSATIEIAE